MQFEWKLSVGTTANSAANILQFLFLSKPLTVRRESEFKKNANRKWSPWKMHHHTFGVVQTRSFPLCEQSGIASRLAKRLQRFITIQLYLHRQKSFSSPLNSIYLDESQCCVNFISRRRKLYDF